MAIPALTADETRTALKDWKYTATLWYVIYKYFHNLEWDEGDKTTILEVYIDFTVATGVKAIFKNDPEEPNLGRQITNCYHDPKKSI